MHLKRTHIVFVRNMTCEKCANKIAAQLDNTRVDYKINLKEKSINITGDNDALHAAKIAINNAGYTIL